MKPVTILVGALGGDGGGVLCDWIVGAAQSQGLGVQATQIPGVAQRTGATTYYLEVMPTQAPLRQVLALNPAIGEVDVALATELLEAGRMIFNGFVTPDRTTLIASINRVFSGWISSPNFARRSANSRRNRSASARCWNPATRSSA